MSNLFLDLKTFDVNNMVFVKPLGFGKFSKNLGVYYKGISESKSNNVATENSGESTDEPKVDEDTSAATKSENYRKQKIIIRTPKMLVPFAVKDFSSDGRKSASVSLSFGNVPYLHNEDEIKKFYHAIRKLDETIESTVKANKKAWNLNPKMTFRKSVKTLSENYPYYMSANLVYDKEVGELFNVYDEKAKACSLEEITKRCVASFVLELTDVWFKDDNCGATWTVLQIRKSRPYSVLRELFKAVCFLEDPDDKDDPAVKHLAMLNAQPKNYVPAPPGPPGPPPPPFLKPPTEQYDWSRREKPTAPPSGQANSSTSFTPSLGDLLAAKDRLKKSSTSLKTQKISALIMSNYATQSVSDANQKPDDESSEENIETDKKSDIDIDLEVEKVAELDEPDEPKPKIIKKKIIKKKLVKPKKPLSQKT
jgi:hypothetical protein